PPSHSFINVHDGGPATWVVDDHDVLGDSIYRALHKVRFTASGRQIFVLPLLHTLRLRLKGVHPEREFSDADALFPVPAHLSLFPGCPSLLVPQHPCALSGGRCSEGEQAADQGHHDGGPECHHLKLARYVSQRAVLPPTGDRAHARPS